jgi:flavin-dependent dehydrogenase
MHTNCTGNASVWESQELHETFAIMNPFGTGWHLDRAAFDMSLRAYVRSICGAEDAPGSVLLRGGFTSVQKDENGWNVEVQSDSAGRQSYRSRWLVDASGRKASVAHKVC